jgi:hypothetical protein
MVSSLWLIEPRIKLRLGCESGGMGVSKFGELHSSTSMAPVGSETRVEQNLLTGAEHG